MSEIESQGSEAIAPPEQPSTPDNSQLTPTEKAAPDYGKVIAGVKKEYRQKGYQEGLEAAKVESMPTEAQVTPNVEKGSAPTGIDEAALARRVSAEIKHSMLVDKIENTDRQGSQKYDDFQEKLEAAGRRAEHDPSFKQMVTKAYEKESPDLIYKLFTDVKVRQELLECHPSEWGNKFNQLLSHKVEMPKIAADPLQVITGAPSSGNTVKTRAELRRMSREKYGR